MSQPQTIMNFTAGAAIAAYRAVRLSAADTVVQAAAATEVIVGVVADVGAVAANDRVDVVMDGVFWVEAGAATTLGGPLTADASGRAVNAAPAAGVNNRLIGFGIDAAAAAGDRIRVKIQPSLMQG